MHLNRNLRRRFAVNVSIEAGRGTPARSVYDEKKNFAPDYRDIDCDASEPGVAKMQGERGKAAVQSDPDPTSRGDVAELRIDF